jgi:hypothetical protein
MKDIIEEYYNIHVLGFISITHYVYKIKCDNQLFVVKIVDNKNIEGIYDYIESLQLKCFVEIIRNKNNELLTPYNHMFFYIMDCLEESIGKYRELKLKTYFEMLSYIHTHSFYLKKVNQEYFKDMYQKILKDINDRRNYYLSIMMNCENMTYRSPCQWLFLLNFYRIDERYKKAIAYLNQYMDLIKNNHSIRVCLIYNHFDYQHIFLKAKKLISIDSMKIDMPIYDIYNIYLSTNDILYDIECLSQNYLKNMKYDKNEKILLCCLLNTVPICNFDDNEIDNIIKISRLLYYIDSINDLCKQLELD